MALSWLDAEGPRSFECPALPPQLLCVLRPSDLIVAARQKQGWDRPNSLYIYGQTPE
jgi:hypothetical protein